MLIDILSSIINDSGCVEGFWGKLDAGKDASLGVAASARPFMIASRFAYRPQTTLVIVAGEDASISYARNIASFLGEEKVLRFPERKDVPFSGSPADPRVVARRLECMDALSSEREVVVVASAASLIRKVAPTDEGSCKPIRLVSGKEIQDMPDANVQDLSELRALIESYGYVNTTDIEGPGTFSSKGGVIDIYPGNMDYPIRLDFFGDELEEIRRIVTSTGQTIASIEEVLVYPVSELKLDSATLAELKRKLEKPALTNPSIREMNDLLLNGIRFDGMDSLGALYYEKSASLPDYMGKGSLVSAIEPRSLFDDARNAFKIAEERASKLSLPANMHFLEPTELSFGDAQRATYASIMQVGADLDDELPVKRTDVAGNPERLFGKMRNWAEGNYICIFSIPNMRVRHDMELELVDHSLPINLCLDSEAEDADEWEDISSGAGKRIHGGLSEAASHIERGAVNIVDVEIPLGLVIPKARLALVSIDDTKSSRTSKGANDKIDITQITFPYSPGDYVVHATYGIAYFRDIVRREFNGDERDYLELDYAEGDKLFLPVEQFDKVTRYVGPQGSTPKITRLESADWSRAMTKARKATKKLAFDLIDVYSRRAASKGHRFKVDSAWMREMEESFPYKETPDQAAAIREVKADMRSSKPMDRLICGDVGFGKTEVALRAAFAAAEEGKQVMVLCPTTILAQQHYTSFKERLDPFGIKVEILSRFRTSAQQKETLERFSEGKVDILIGTHRLLSNDVNPHDLGLVIIDEEQRFGVGHKEQFKNLRESIDVLTLSATPIPRTMQMAVSGVKDMSLILTPPSDRLPVKVHVGEWDPDVVSDAIRFELARNGQVYYVSNRVRTIEEAARRVREAAPEARIGLAHGKLSKDELESVMEEFSAGNLDVLVATTIIESGIDNPHTNTLIIEDSQRLGLSQMYQLKGRVGRSSEQAYAYFMFPEEIPLTEEAASRLTALSDYQDLGSGMRIAMRDLEIRGAGSILGAEQSGNISEVGFDLYAQMLNQAVIDAREGIGADGEGVRTLSDININVPSHTYLSQDYIPDIDARVLFYRKIANAATVSEVDDIEQELLSFAPEMPEEAKNLLAKTRLRSYANEHGISNISIAAGNMTIDGIVIDKADLPPIKRKGGRYLSEKRRLIIPLKRIGMDNNDTDMISKIFDFLHELHGETEPDDVEGEDR